MLMWSSPFIFWLLVGGAFCFWSWVFEISLPSLLLPTRDSKESSRWFVLLLTSFFVWCYFLLYSSINFTMLTITEITALCDKLPTAPVPLCIPISMNVFVFLYIFILITSLSLVFCITYNKKESSHFYIYVLVIFAAGTFFFTTSSLPLRVRGLR